MENGVLHAANVLFNRKPISNGLAGERRFVVVRVSVAVEVHDESTKVSMVSVSRRAGPPHFGQIAFTNSALDQEVSLQ